MRAGLLLLCAAAVVALWFFLRPATGPVANPATPTKPSAVSAPQALTNNASPNSNASTGLPLSASPQAGNGSSTVPARLEPLPPELASLPPETILDNMRTTFRQYRDRFGGNPVGTNPEITRALQGENPKQINFLKADGNRVNGNGELVDPWGTPYFFHQLSAKEMEIHSAGPDGKMWTQDDLIIK